jgi:ribosomal protein L37AE/L43A
MASCPKCGRAKIVKSKAGFRSCRRCGVLSYTPPQVWEPPPPALIIRPPS